MRFLAPAMLAWLALLIAVLALYLVRPRPRRFTVATLPFFAALDRQSADAPWLRRLKRLLSFLISAAVVIAACFGLAQAIAAPLGDAARLVVLVVDRSASMASRDATGTTRLDAVRDAARIRLAGLPAGTAVAVIAADARADIVLPPTSDRRAAERALDALVVRPIAASRDDAAAALALAERLAATETPAQVWWLSDQPAPPRSRGSASSAVSATGSAVSLLAISAALNTAARSATSGLPPGRALAGSSSASASSSAASAGIASDVNVGITACDLRRVPLQPGTCELFVQLDATGPVAVTLTVSRGARLTQVRKVDFAVPDADAAAAEDGPADPQRALRRRLIVPVEAAQDEAGQALRVAIELADGRRDCLDSDDAVNLRLPGGGPLRVRLFSQGPADGYLQLALAGLHQAGSITVTPTALSDYRDGIDGDVLMFSRCVPPAWPHGRAIVLHDPPTSVAPLDVRPLHTAAGSTLPNLPVGAPRSGDASHPVLYGVAAARLDLLQTSVISAESGLMPLWHSDVGALLLAGEIAAPGAAPGTAPGSGSSLGSASRATGSPRSSRAVVTAFAAHSPRLALLPSWPLLIGNALFWTAAPDLERAQGKTYRTGEFATLRGTKLSWDDGSSQALRGGFIEFTRAGLWTTDAGERGTSALLSQDETRLVFRPDPAATATSADQSIAARGRAWGGDLIPFLAGLVLVLLLGELWLLHRQGVH